MASLPYIPYLTPMLDRQIRNSAPVENQLRLPVGATFTSYDIDSNRANQPLGMGANTYEGSQFQGARQPPGGIPATQGRAKKVADSWLQHPYHTWRTVAPGGYVYRVYQPVAPCENYGDEPVPANAAYCAVGPKFFRYEGKVSHGYDLRPRRFAEEPFYPSTPSVYFS